MPVIRPITYQRIMKAFPPKCLACGQQYSLPWNAYDINLYKKRSFFHPWGINIRSYSCGAPMYISLQSHDFLGSTKKSSFPNGEPLLSYPEFPEGNQLRNWNYFNRHDNVTLVAIIFAILWHALLCTTWNLDKICRK